MVPEYSSSTPAPLRFGAVPLRLFFAGVELEDGVVAPVGAFHRRQQDAQHDVDHGHLLVAEVYGVEIDPNTVQREAAAAL